jgi:CRP-like cAMP-binding protein
MSSATRTNPRNRLLQALELGGVPLFQNCLERVDLPVRSVLVEPNEPPRYIHFIESGLGSVIASSTDGEHVEIGHVGFEGMTGTHVLLQAETTPSKTFMQVGGEGLRVPVEVFLNIVEADRATRHLLLRYVQCSELQLAHSALANARYSVNERLARWLLMCHDRLDGDNLPLTHEFLALMVGVRRSGITNSLHILEGMKSIRASRGNIRILNRSRLVETAGGSYGIPEAEYNRLIGSLTPAAKLPC